MLEVGLVSELDPKVVDNETERDGPPHMAPEAGYVLALVVSSSGQPALQQLIG